MRQRHDKDCSPRLDAAYVAASNLGRHSLSQLLWVLCYTFISYKTENHVFILHFVSEFLSQVRCKTGTNRVT